MNKLCLLLTFLFIHTSISAQLDVNVYTTPNDMVKDELMGQSVRAMNVRYEGHVQSRGSFMNENTIIPFKHGVVLSSGYVTAIPGKNKSSSFSGVMGKAGDLDLEKIAAGDSKDAAVLEFDFVATNEMVSFRYIFASEEYPEYVNSQFNDVFAFYLTDKLTKETWNLATIPTTTSPISINTINNKWNFKYYISNLPEDINKFRYDLEMIEMDGLTKPLVAYHPVEKGRPYHIKIAICDVGDGNLDSSVFLEGGSFSSQTQEEFYEENLAFINSFEESKNNVVQKPRKPKNAVVKELEDKSERVEEVSKESTELPELIVYFDTDEHTLSTSEFQKLEMFISNNKELVEGTWDITGHTDSVGSNQYNLELSKRRAKAIEKILLEETQKSCTIAWKGEGLPLNSNSTEKEKALNRRVVIQFQPER